MVFLGGESLEFRVEWGYFPMAEQLLLTMEVGWRYLYYSVPDSRLLRFAIIKLDAKDCIKEYFGGKPMERGVLFFD